MTHRRAHTDVMSLEVRLSNGGQVLYEDIGSGKAKDLGELRHYSYRVDRSNELVIIEDLLPRSSRDEDARRREVSKLGVEVVHYTSTEWVMVRELD